MQQAYSTIPGSFATLVICSNTAASKVWRRCSVAKKRAGTFIPSRADVGSSQRVSESRLRVALPTRVVWRDIVFSICVDKCNSPTENDQHSAETDSFVIV